MSVQSNPSQKKEQSELAALRDSSTQSILPDESHSVTRVETRAETIEVPLREVANLESEWNALNLRRSRLAPLMDDCGEPLY